MNQLDNINGFEDFGNIEKYGFIIVGQDGYRNSLKIKKKPEYMTMLDFAKNSRYYIYFGLLEGNHIQLPYILDRASTKHPVRKKVQEVPVEIKSPSKSSVSKQETKKPLRIEKDDEDVIDRMKEVAKADLTCPNCGKSLNSSSGYTLHLKKCKKA